MARLLTSFDAVMWCRDIPSMTIESDAPEVEIIVVAGAENLMTLHLAPYNGRVVLHEVDDAMESMMKFEGKSIEKMTLKFRDAGEDNFQESGVVTVVYAAAHIQENAVDWLASHFLTTVDAKWLQKEGGGDLIGFIELEEGKSLSPRYDIAYRVSGEGNKVQVLNYSSLSPVVSTGGVQMLHVTASELAEIVAKQGVDGAEIIGVTLRVEKRIMTWYCHELTSPDVWRFKNAFNVEEQCCLEGVTTQKTSDNRKIAMVGRKAVAYGENELTEWTLESAPVSLELARWLAELAISHEVTKNGEVVVVTDCTAEVSDEMGKMNVVKITYRRPDGGRMLAQEGKNKVFTKEFDYQYT